MTTQKFDKFKITWILIEDIMPHPRIQRPFNKKWAEKISAEFDPDLFLPLNVIPSRREGKFFAFGGQHRLHAAAVALGKGQRVPCHIHPDAPVDKQAEICLGMDKMLNWRAVDRWPVRIIANEEIPLAIEKILRNLDLRVAKARTSRTLVAVAALETVYRKRGSEILSKTLNILNKSYGDDKDAFDGTLIRGASFFLHNFDGQVNESELVKKLSTHSGPSRMVGSAKDYSKTTGVSIERAMAERLTKVYNAGKRKARLKLSLSA